jgi:hypothetical protein
MTTPRRTPEISSRNSPQDLRDLRAAAREFGREAHQLPGRSGLVFRNVAECVVLASMAATTSLAMYHLWKELHRSDECKHRSHDEHRSR